MKKFKAFDHDIYDRACKVIAHGALTNSKRPESFVKGVYPTHLTRSQGCYSWDTQGNKYIDFICGLGTNLLGAANEQIEQAVIRQAKRGFSHSLGTDLEIEVAEMIKARFPFVEKLRFLKTGSEACSAAVRIARTYTKKKWILSDGYHGWHDAFVSLTPPANGVVFNLQIGMLDDLNCHAETFNTAGVIIEPDQFVKNSLIQLRKCLSDGQVCLIYDEVITGLRYLSGSYAQFTGVLPDLICMGKALGGGLPLSLVGGRADIMESDYFVSSTFAGETLSLAACKEVLKLTEKEYLVSKLWEEGVRFQERFNSIWPDIQLKGYGTRGAWSFSGNNPTELKALFFQECCKAGLLVGPSFFLCFPHLEILDQCLNLFNDVITRIKLGSVKLEGEMPVQPYAQKVRDQTTGR